MGNEWGEENIEHHLVLKHSKPQRIGQRHEQNQQQLGPPYTWWSKLDYPAPGWTYNMARAKPEPQAKDGKG